MYTHFIVCSRTEARFLPSRGSQNQFYRKNWTLKLFRMHIIVYFFLFYWKSWSTLFLLEVLNYLEKEMHSLKKKRLSAGLGRWWVVICPFLAHGFLGVWDCKLLKYGGKSHHIESLSDLGLQVILCPHGHSHSEGHIVRQSSASQRGLILQTGCTWSSASNLRAQMHLVWLNKFPELEEVKVIKKLF